MVSKRLATLLAVLFASAFGSVQAADRPPNVVVILADDLGVNDLHCYGRKDHNTPNLDKLAASGARFANAYAACSVCSPTRAALMTGKSPARLHITTFLPGRPNTAAQKVLHPDIQQKLPLEEVTIAEHFKAAGYATGCFGKWHLGGKGFLPSDQGFEQFEAGTANTTPSETEGGKGEYALTARAIKFLTEQKEKPFFLYLPHNTPHIPYKAKDELVKKNAEAFEPTYAAVIESMDECVGKVLNSLDELKLAENTIVVFTSDNGGLHVPEGPHARITHNTPYRAGKGYLYEGGLRVPAILRYPGKVKAGTTVDLPVITMDWLPTLLELTGQKKVAGLDGASFANALTGGTQKARPLYWHIPHYMNQGGRPGGAVRDGNWKFIEFYDGGDELYDLAKDPGERVNLATKEKAKAKAYKDGLAVWRVAMDAQENAPNPNFDAGRHKALYFTIDPSQYRPATAKAEEHEQVQAWRKGMNAVLPKPKP